MLRLLRRIRVVDVVTVPVAPAAPVELENGEGDCEARCGCEGMRRGRSSPRRSSSEENRRLRFESDTERASDFFARLVRLVCVSCSRTPFSAAPGLAARALARAATFSTPDTDTDTEDLRVPNSLRDVRFARAVALSFGLGRAASGSPAPALSSRMLVERDQRELDAAAASVVEAEAEAEAEAKAEEEYGSADVNVLVKVRTSVVDAVGVWSCGQKCG